MTGDTVSAAGCRRQPRDVRRRSATPTSRASTASRARSFHTGDWHDDHSLAGERVAIIGSAASAVQMLPEVAKLARQVHLFQRSANWVLPKDDTPVHRRAARGVPAEPRRGRRRARGAVPRLRRRPTVLAILSVNAERRAERPRVHRGRLKTPRSAPGSRRRRRGAASARSSSNEYYPTFNLPHVELVTDPIVAITPTGCVTADGTEREVDTIIYATGYETTKFASVIDFVGRDGVHLRDAWADGAQAYLGITTSGFPNLFMLYGPNTNAGSIIYMIECQVDYIVGTRRNTWKHEGLAWIDVRPEVMAAYNEQLQSDIDEVEVWQGGCSTYYRVPSGRIVTQWPHSMARYRELTDRQFARGVRDACPVASLTSPKSRRLRRRGLPTSRRRAAASLRPRPESLRDPVSLVAPCGPSPTKPA